MQTARHGDDRYSELVTPYRLVPPKLQKFPFTGRFLDVSACVDLFEDYHPDHMFGRAQDMAYRKELYRYFQKDLGLVVGGEHGKAWVVTDLDYTEGMLSGPFWWEMPAGYLVPPKSKDDLKENYVNWGDRPDRRIPLWDLVYHDCVATTWYWGDCNGYYSAVAPEMSDRKDLFTMLHGQLPLRWTTDAKPGEPLDYGWSRNRERFLETCRHAGLLNEQVAFEEMLSHEFLSADRMVQRTRFSSGGWCVVNFSQESRPLDDDGVNVVLAPSGFLAKAGPAAQSRLVEGGQIVTRVDAPGYHSLQTLGHPMPGPISTTGRLTVFEYEPGRWHILAESTAEASVDMRVLAGADYAKTRLIALDDEGSDRETLPAAAGTDGRVRIPGGTGLRLFRVVAITPAPHM
ncbi:MAG: glycoside hydrolase [Pirellulaceae bacterium]